MQRMPPVAALAFCSVIAAGCANMPQRAQAPLIQQSHYSEEIFLSQQGLHLFGRTWQPQTPTPKANVVILHGTALHSGIYEPVAERLTAAGYRVYAFDMQGWGRSEGKGADGYVDSFDDYSKDLYTVLNRLKMRYPDTPNYVMGESLGGAVALYSMLKKNIAFDGIITSAVGYKPNPSLLGIRAPGFISGMNLTAAKWWGYGFPNWPVAESDMGIRMVIDDDALQEKLLHDPEVSHGWLPGAYVSSLAEATEVIEYRLRELHKPILLLHGTHDMLVPPASSQEIFDVASSTFKRIKLYDSPHAVLLENAQAAALGDVIEFLDDASRQKMVAGTQ